MRFLALATDYDGTLATNGQVDEATLAALKRLRESGRKLILVSGRHLDDLYTVFPEVGCCCMKRGWGVQRDKFEVPPDKLSQR